MTSEPRFSHFSARVAGIVAIAIAALGCGPGDAKAPNPTRALDERRAIEVIRRAIQELGDQPAPGRDEKLPNGKKLYVDVAVPSRGYAIAYISGEDSAALGDAIPVRNQKDEKLHVLHAAESDTKVVFLYQDNYRFDDLAGEAHEQTTITAERSLARDVQDFVTYAHRGKK